MATCSVENCEAPIYAKEMCRQHWNRMRMYGRLHKIRGIEKPLCSVEGCLNKSDNKGLCPTHYERNRKHGRFHKIRIGDKRNHPFYMMWFERKQTNSLCEEWLDFQDFVAAISPKPEGNYLLIRLKDGPFGPDNFKWQECLKRKKEETAKEWNARQRVAQLNKHPSMESDRNIRRVYGLSRKQYDAILWLQKGVCAICFKSEIAKSRTGGTKQLSVDHCHKTMKNRGLLCSNCNTTLGRTGDSVELLQSMINYLLKHKEV